ncbi:MAG: methionyl-tRNA formyltransferase [Actinobacteria bacterium]|uniref:methionyl-tRNA formyltransferase n=1 Tax=freshwater metagenome TaxID=449393 RepID=A0A6J7DEQ5_9ZZZZ|nr:methionyl-tRNA formyltransferase [Actinomycetota bacterium]
MRCVFAGTPDVAGVALRSILNSPHEVVAVITRPDSRTGRGQNLVPSAVAELAHAEGIPILTPTDLHDLDFEMQLRALEPDCCPVVAYGALVPPTLLSVPLHGWVNLHFSLLPSWRGAAPVQWAVLTGDVLTGATTFSLEAGLDTGPIFGTVTEQIGDLDTSGSVLERLAEAGGQLLVATLDAISSNSIEALPQRNFDISYAPKLTGEDARIRWTDPWVGVDRRIRATTPNPGPWTLADGERIKLGPLNVDQVVSDISLSPGQLALVDGAVLVGTATKPARLNCVQPAGKKLMPAGDWIRGLRSQLPRFE